jgi:hypothetical protein
MVRLRVTRRILLLVNWFQGSEIKGLNESVWDSAPNSIFSSEERAVCKAPDATPRRYGSTAARLFEATEFDDYDLLGQHTTTKSERANA